MPDVIAEFDILTEIFVKQRELNASVAVPHGVELDDEGKAHWLLQFSRALAQENAELIDSVPWKWWAKYQEFDIQNARVEAIDMLHFLVSIFQTLDMTPKDVYDAYMAKHAVNVKRQEDGYATKDEDDSRHI